MLKAHSRLISSSQTAGGTAERHEGWRHASPGNHRQDTPGRRSAANVREEHPQPIGQPGPRGRRSEPVTDLTADASAALTNHLARFSLTDWGLTLSPHRQRVISVKPGVSPTEPGATAIPSSGFYLPLNTTALNTQTHIIYSQRFPTSSHSISPNFNPKS